MRCVLLTVSILCFVGIKYAEVKGKEVFRVQHERGIEHAMYINLDHRVDRRVSIQSQLELANIPYERLPAADVKNDTTALELCVSDPRSATCLAKLGCKLSHIKALQHGISNRLPHIAVFEDDFAWLPHTNPGLVQGVIRTMQRKMKDWDVLLLSMNVVEQQEVVPRHDLLIGRTMSRITRVLDAQTTHGYVVNAHYFTELKSVFEQCNVTQSYEVAIDQCWKPLQRNDQWYGFYPQIARQLSGFSDIEGGFTTNDFALEHPT